MTEAAPDVVLVPEPGALRRGLARVAAAVRAWRGPAARAELAARLARCEAVLSALHVEEGVLVARGFRVRDAEGRERFTVGVAQEDVTVLALVHRKGGARFSVYAREVGPNVVFVDSAGETRAGLGIEGENLTAAVHAPDGSLGAGVLLDGSQVTLRVAAPEASEADVPAPLPSGGYL